MDALVAQFLGKREIQEDAYGVKHFPQGVLGVVSDGMGGHDCGDQASKTAVAAFLEAFQPSMGQSASSVLGSALNYANAQVAKLFADETKFGGCTLLACYVSGMSLHWVSVGDSPLFLWRGRRLLRLNQDHSMRSVYQDLAQPGIHNHDDSARRGHMLRSALTGGNIAMIDSPCSPYPLLPGDRVILASDGIEDVLYPKPLSTQAEASLNDRSAPLASQLVQCVVDLDSPVADNVTVLTLDI